MRTCCLAALFSLLLVSHASSETPAEAAAAALEAIRVEKPESLRLLAERSEPDPWLVARELCVKKQFEAARNFVLAAPRADTASLVGHIDAWEKDPAAPTIMDGTMGAATTAIAFLALLGCLLIIRHEMNSMMFWKCYFI